jgi:uncharacterized membrane protein YhaH (DUF805 family)
MVSFADAVKRAFSGYATFAGRSTRAEFWWFALFVWIVQAVLYIPLMASLPDSGEDASGAFWVWVALLTIFALVMLLPYISVTVRRLHDSDRSGWWYWISLVPCIGGIWLIILLVTPSTPGQNRFG